MVQSTVRRRLFAAIAFLLVSGSLQAQRPGWTESHVLISPQPAGLPAPGPTPNALSCVLSSGSLLQPNEGPTDYRLHHPPTSPLNAVMIFVDFSDAPQSETTTSLFNLLVPNAVSYYNEVSYGLFTLNVTPVNKWYRMPLTAAAYGFNTGGLTFNEQRSYIADAVAISTSEVDYRGYGAIFVVASNTPHIPISPTMLAYPTQGVPADGNELRLGVTFGRDIRTAQANYGSHVMAHEVGHILGLPDLYQFSLPFPQFSHFAGGWDIMSFLATGSHFLAFHKFKLGWLSGSGIACLADGQTELTLTPLETGGGLKAAIAPLTGSRAYVVEVRQNIGRDAGLCDRGVLVYLVNALVPTGSGPVVVRASQPDASASLQSQCGYLYAAPYDLGGGEIGRYEDPSGPFSVEIVSKSGNDYRVRISFGAACAPASITTPPQNRSIFTGTRATLSVAASGTQPLTFQWYLGASGDVSRPVGPSSNQLDTGVLTQTTSYWVRVSNSCGSANSATATVTVNPCDAPQITSSPLSQTILTGSSATLVVSHNGTPPFTYQWYRGTAADTSSPVGGSSPSYATPLLTQSTSYWVRISNACGSADSTTAVVTVTLVCSAPVITKQPDSKDARWGETTTLTVAASGTDPLTYQWYLGSRGDTSKPIGTNSPAFATPPITATARYWARVSNRCGSADSTSAEVRLIGRKRPARRR